MSQGALSTWSAWQRTFEEYAVPFDTVSSDVACDFNLLSASAFNESNSVLDLSSASVLLSALDTDTDVQESECHLRDECGRNLDVQTNACVTVSSYKTLGISKLSSDGVSNSFANNPYICDLSQSLTEVNEIDNLVGNIQMARGPYRADFGCDDGASEWTDSLLCDLQAESADVDMVSCLDTDPCKSTESSELSAAIKGSSYWNENNLPDETCVSNKAVFSARSCSDQVSTSWSQNSGTKALGFPCDLMSSSSTDFISTNFLQVSADRELLDDGQGCKMQHELHNTKNMRSARVNGESVVPFASQNRRRNEYDGARRPDLEGELGNFRSGRHQDPARRNHLIQLLLECARIESDHGKATNVLANLRSLSSRNGDPMQRLAASFTEALSVRLGQAQNLPVRTSSRTSSICENECSPQVLTVAYKALNEACPYFAFAQLTANQAIVEAIGTADKVHIIDFGFGIAQGVQWAALLQAIASKERGRRPSRIRITGVGWAEVAEKRAETLAAAVERLVKFGKIMDLTVEFRAVTAAAAEEEVTVEEGEVVAANLMLGLCNLGAEGTEAAAVMRVVERFAPAVLAVAEMEAPPDGVDPDERFLNKLKIYAALFDSWDACMPRDCPHRLNMERWLLSQSVDELLVPTYCDHYVWRAALEAAGFRLCPRSHYAVSQARVLLSRFCDAFTLSHEPDTFSLSLLWQNRPLVHVSAWSSR